MTDRQIHKVTYGMGLDIGGTKILMMIIDDKGNVILREKVRTSNNVREIIEIIKDCIYKANIDQKDIIGMGVGIPGKVHSEKGIAMDVPALKWKHVELKKIFEEHFIFPTYVKNDVKYAVIGERWLGNGKNKQNIFYLSIGTGIGSAIIANGQIIEGHEFSAGEIGYFIEREDVRNGRKNTIDDFGIFEKKASGKALSEKGMEYGYSSKELFMEYRKNNQNVIPVIKEFILKISIAIANVVSLLNPEIVIIGGGVSESMDCVIDEIRNMVSNLTPFSTNIELSKLGGDAGAVGGSAYAFDQIKNKSI